MYNNLHNLIKTMVKSRWRQDKTVLLFMEGTPIENNQIYQSCQSAFSLLQAKVDGPSFFANLFGIQD